MQVGASVFWLSLILQLFAVIDYTTASKANVANINRPRGARGQSKNPRDKKNRGRFTQDLVDDVNAPDEQRLMLAMLHNYEPASRPVYNASHVVLVKFGLTLAQIFDMDEVNQVLTTNVWLEQEWYDERLKWNPANYSGLHVLRIPCQRIWLPDIVLYNSADDFTEGFMQSKAMVSHTGNVFWPPPARLRSSCKIDITYFPFDDQRCLMKFGSWTYDGLQVDVTNRSNFVDLTNYIYSGEWELLDITVKRNEVYYPCCLEPYPDVTFVFIMRRRTLYYLFNIIFPCLWLTVLSLLGFWLPPESGEKITLGITVLLAFSVFMLLIAESMPATSEFVPLIGIYLTVTMAMTSLSIMLTVFVLQLHHAGPHQRSVPAWIRTLVVGYVARILCMRSHLGSYYDSVSPTTANAPNATGELQPSAVAAAESGICNNVSRSRTRSFFTSSSANKKLKVSGRSQGPNSNNSSSSFPRVAIPSVNVEGENTSAGASEDERLQTSDKWPTGSKGSAAATSYSEDFDDKSFRRAYCEPRTSLADGFLGTSVVGPSKRRPFRRRSGNSHERAIARHLKIYLSRHRAEQDFEDVVNEWRLVAHIMDRLLFWLFLIGSFLSTVVILVVMPLLKPDLTDKR